MRYLSASQLTLYADCALKYKFRYIDKIQKPSSSIHLVYGTAIHKVLEIANISLKETGKADVIDVLQAFEDEWAQELKAQNMEKDFFRNKLYYMGLNGLIKYMNEFIDYEPLATEGKFKFSLHGCEIVGVIDLIYKKKDKIIILDYKTSKEPFNMFKLNTSVQLALYSLAFESISQQNEEIKAYLSNRKNQKEDYIAYCVFLKDYETLEGNIKIQKKKITEDHIKRLDWILRESIRGIEAGLFLPNYLAQCNWCEFKKECVEFTGEK